VAVVVLVFICLKDLVEQTIVRDSLVPDVDDVPDQRDDGHAARNQDGGMGDALRRTVEVDVVDQRSVKDCGKH
jgi:hypothetical protein